MLGWFYPGSLSGSKQMSHLSPNMIGISDGPVDYDLGQTSVFCALLKEWTVELNFNAVIWQLFRSLLNKSMINKINCFNSLVQVQTSPVSPFHLSSRLLPAQIVHSHASMMPADCWWDVRVTFSRQLPCASADRLVDGRCWNGTCENPRADPEKSTRSPDHHLNQESTHMSH